MGSIRFLVVFLIFLTNFYPAFAQTKQSIEVLHLPRKAEYSASQLNKDLAKAKSLKQAENIITSNKAIKNCRILLTARNKDGEKIWHVVNTETKSSENGNWVVLRSKDAFNGRFQNLNDLRVALSDTVLVLDTLKLNFSMSGQQYNNKGFFLLYNCFGETAAKKVMLTNDGKPAYSLTKQSFDCNNIYIAAKVYNETNPTRELSKVTFRFADEDLLEELNAVTTHLHASEDYPELKELAIVIQSFLSRQYGKIETAILVDWLKKQQMVKLNGLND